MKGKIIYISEGPIEPINGRLDDITIHVLFDDSHVMVFEGHIRDIIPIQIYDGEIPKNCDSESSEEDEG